MGKQLPITKSLIQEASNEASSACNAKVSAKIEHDKYELFAIQVNGRIIEEFTTKKSLYNFMNGMINGCKLKK